MECSNEINPISKKQDICSLLQRLNCQYKIYNVNSDKEYEYLKENDQDYPIDLSSVYLSGDSSGGGDSESDGSYDDSSGSEDYGDDSSGDSDSGDYYDEDSSGDDSYDTY